MTASALDSVRGLGEHRRKALVTHFGSVARLKEASVEEITAVPGIGILLDVALDPYNSDGHDGLVRDGVVLNDESLLALEKMGFHVEAAHHEVSPGRHN